MRLFASFFLVLGFCGCCCKSSSKDGGLTRFYEDGRAKPVVVLPAVVDTTSFDLSWSLSEELTTMMVQRVSDGGSVCVVSGDDVSFSENPFGSDLSWMKRDFADYEFVAFSELVEHEAVPVSVSSVEVPFETAMNLKMAVRLRLVDLRPSVPRVVLQEMVRDTYYVPKTAVPVDYKVVVWGDAEYVRSPMGIAHTQLMQEVSSRIRDYVQLAKSR